PFTSHRSNCSVSTSRCARTTRKWRNSGSTCTAAPKPRGRPAGKRVPVKPSMPYSDLRTTMKIGKQGAELVELYARRIQDEIRLLARLDTLLQDGCRDLVPLLSLSQEVFAAHAQSASIYLKLQKYRYDRNMGLDEEDG